MVPSLLRAFVMFSLGMFFLRSNIKIVSFRNLFFTIVLIVSFFPKFIFSLAFWFSISAVFYIFLYVKYFSRINIIFKFLLFNFWIFFAMNPLVHYFFDITTLYQLYSPFLTYIFIVFYPLELFLHILTFGNIFDTYLELFISKDIITYTFSTPLWFLIIYILISLFSVFFKIGFYILNLILLFFNIFIYSLGLLVYN